MTAPTQTHSRSYKVLSFGCVVIGSGICLSAAFCPDYMQALLSKDGIYIPDSTYVAKAQNKPAGSNLVHVFRIYNARPRRLTVEADADCGCTGLSWKSASIAPFGWKNISAEMKKTSFGSQSVSITVHTSSKVQPYIAAVMRG